MRWEKRRIDVKRDGEKYMTLYSTEDLAERVIEVSSSLPGALGSAYQRVDEMLSGYAQIPANGAGTGTPRAPYAVKHEHGSSGRRKQRRKARPQPHLVKRAAAGLAALLILLAPALPAAARHPYTQAGHLRIGVVRDFDTLNPLLSTQAAVTDLAQLIFSGLIRYDDHGDPVPDAAAAVPTRANGGISADGKTITYRLRANAAFSDGAPLTASDVVFTWRQVLNKNNNVANHFPYDLAESVSAKGPHTVVVRLREPNAAFAAFFMRCGTQGAILPEHLLRGKHDLNRDPFNRQPVGSGPFVVTSFQPGSVVELARNPHWWGKRPALDRISYRIIPNENSLLVALRTHEIDFYYAAPEQQYRELRGLAGVHVSARPFASYEQVAFNTRRAPFDDVRVRRAAAQVDRLERRCSAASTWRSTCPA